MGRETLCSVRFIADIISYLHCDVEESSHTVAIEELLSSFSSVSLSLNGLDEHHQSISIINL